MRATSVRLDEKTLRRLNDLAHELDVSQHTLLLKGIDLVLVWAEQERAARKAEAKTRRAA